MKKKINNLVEKIKWIKKKNSKFPIIISCYPNTQTNKQREIGSCQDHIKKWNELKPQQYFFMQYPHNPALKWNELIKKYY